MKTIEEFLEDVKAAYMALDVDQKVPLDHTVSELLKQLSDDEYDKLGDELFDQDNEIVVSVGPPADKLEGLTAFGAMEDVLIPHWFSQMLRDKDPEVAQVEAKRLAA